MARDANQAQINPPAPLPDELRAILRDSFFIRTATRGRRSGHAYLFETTYVWDGDRTVYLSGYPGRRDWVANIAVDPNVVLHTVEGGAWYAIPAQGRVVRGREERLPYLLAFIERWTVRGVAPRPLFRLALGAIRLNRRLHLPWWGPFYVARRIFDGMPCVEVRMTGLPARSADGPPSLGAAGPHDAGTR